LAKARSTDPLQALAARAFVKACHQPRRIPCSCRFLSPVRIPFEVVAVYGAQITLDLPETFGKAHRRVNICCLKFFEALDACFVESDARPTPLVGGAGVTCYEVSRISDAQTHKGQHELWVEWRGYDQSHNCWVNCDVLMVDVPALVVAFDTQPSIFQAPASAPKRATTGYKSVVPVASPVRRVSTRARFFFKVFCRHTASAPITAGMHTSGMQ